MSLDAGAVEADVVWFRSKVDWWLGVLLVALPVTGIAVCIVAIVAGELETAALSFLVGVLPIGVLMGGLAWPVRYGVTASTLIVRFGLFRQTVRLDEISEVRPSHNLLSSPALSLDRLLVRHGKGRFNFTLISPARRSEFLDVLASRTKLVRRGDALLPPD